MTAVTLPNAGLKAGYILGENGWTGSMNLNLRTLDALMNLRVLDKDLAIPPSTPTGGDTYIVATGGTGAWSTHDGKIAVWQVGDDLTSAWFFVTPKDGWQAYVVDETMRYRYASSTWTVVTQPIPVACSDESTALTTGTKVTFHMPFTAKLESIFAGLTTAQTAGSLLTVNLKKNGTTVFSTMLTFDNSELTTLSAATPVVISAPSFAKGDLVTVSIDQVGTSGAMGLKLYPSWSVT